MSKAESAVEAAAFAALSAGVTLATVYQHVPQDTPPPVTIVGDVDSEPFGTKGPDPDRRCNLNVVSVVQGEARKPLLDLQEEIETALDGLKVSVAGWTLDFEFAGSDGLLLEDGESYVGNSRFAVIALKD